VDLAFVPGPPGQGIPISPEEAASAGLQSVIGVASSNEASMDATLTVAADVPLVGPSVTNRTLSAAEAVAFVATLYHQGPAAAQALIAATVAPAALRAPSVELQNGLVDSSSSIPDHTALFVPEVLPESIPSSSSPADSTIQTMTNVDSQAQDAGLDNQNSDNQFPLDSDGPPQVPVLDQTASVSTILVSTALQETGDVPVQSGESGGVGPEDSVVPVGASSSSSSLPLAVPAPLQVHATGTQAASGPGNDSDDSSSSIQSATQAHSASGSLPA
jgi:hypothetical protein